MTVGGVLNRESGHLRGSTGLGRDIGRIHVPVVSGGKGGRLHHNGGVERFPGVQVHPSGGGDVELNHNRGVDRFPAVSGGRRLSIHGRGLLDRASLVSGGQYGTGLDGGVYPGKRSGLCQGLWSANGLGRNSLSKFDFL